MLKWSALCAAAAMAAVLAGLIGLPDPFVAIALLAGPSLAAAAVGFLGLAVVDRKLLGRGDVARRPPHRASTRGSSRRPPPPRGRGGGPRTYERRPS